MQKILPMLHPTWIHLILIILFIRYLFSNILYFRHTYYINSCMECRYSMHVWFWCQMTIHNYISFTKFLCTHSSASYSHLKKLVYKNISINSHIEANCLLYQSHTFSMAYYSPKILIMPSLKYVFNHTHLVELLFALIL